MLELSERTIQTVAVKALHKIGCSVIETSNTRWTRNTPGAPDIYVHIKKSLWLAIEIKKPGGKLSPRQKELAERGKILVLDSVEGIVRAVLDAKVGK